MSKLSLVSIVNHINNLFKSDPSIDKDKPDINVHGNNLVNNCVFNILPKNSGIVDMVDMPNIVNIVDMDNMVVIDDFPPDCKRIFMPYVSSVFRHPCNSNMYDSILTCISKEYRELKTDNDKEVYISVLRNKMINDLTEKKLFKILEYKNKQTLVTNLNKNIINKPVLKYFSDYFNINIFIANIVEDRILCVYPEEISIGADDHKSFDKHKPTIFLSFYEDILEPLSYGPSDFIWNDNPCYNKIITSNINLIHKWDGTLDDIIMDDISLDPFIIIYDDTNKYSHRMADIIYRGSINNNTVNLEAEYDHYTEN